MSDVTQLRPARLEDLVLTDREQRAYEQGYMRGRADAERANPPRKSRKALYREGLQRRANWFFMRRDLALAAGDEQRALRLEGWALDEERRLAERGETDRD